MPIAVPDGRKAGSLTWAGLYNTYYWIDPATRVAGVIMMQILPFADRPALKVYREFEQRRLPRGTPSLTWACQVGSQLGRGSADHLANSGGPSAR